MRAVDKHGKDPRLVLAFVVSYLVLWALALLCVLDAAAASPRHCPPAREAHACTAARAEKRSPLHILTGVTVTHYDACALCCGKSDGITASGAPAEPYLTCAVDLAVIPLGSVVRLDFGGGDCLRCIAQDTGGAVRGAHIDLCVASHAEALALGVRVADVRWK